MSNTSSASIRTTTIHLALQQLLDDYQSVTYLKFGSKVRTNDVVDMSSTFYEEGYRMPS